MSVWSFYRELRALREGVEESRDSERKEAALLIVQEVYEIAENELELEEPEE